MTKQTFNIIMACKGRFDLIQATESFEGIEIKDTAYERVITYMAKECGLDEKYYDEERMYNILFDTMVNYLSTGCTHFSEFFSCIKLRPLPGYEKDLKHKCSLKGTAERIADAFINVAVQCCDSNGKRVHINGFEKYFDSSTDIEIKNTQRWI